MHCSRCFHTTPLQLSTDATFCPEVEAEDYACFDGKDKKDWHWIWGSGYKSKAVCVGCVRVMWMAEWSGLVIWWVLGALNGVVVV